MNNPENDLILLEMGSRIRTLEETVAGQALMLNLVMPTLATLQEMQLHRIQQTTKKNG